MIAFVIQKLLQKKWMVISLLVGNILFVSITCCNPMYMEAALQKMLSRNLSSSMEETNLYPGTVSASSTLLRGNEAFLDSVFFKETDRMGEKIQEMLPLPVLQTIRFRKVKEKDFIPDLIRESDYARKTAAVGSLTGLENHSSILIGSFYSTERDENGVIDCVVSQTTMVRLNLLLNEIITMQKLYDADGNEIRLRIAGVFEASDENDVYWATSPAQYGMVFFIDETLFEKEVYEASMNNLVYTTKDTVLYDYMQFTPEDTESMQEFGEYLIAEAAMKGTTECEVNYMTAVNKYIEKSGNVTTTMWILQVPTFLLLAAFIFMVSGQMIQMEQNEIAVLKSRGVSKGQIVLVYLAQSSVISLISLIIGIPCAYLMCRILGATNTFMEFIGRKSLVLTIDKTVILYGVIACLLSIAMMTIPALKSAGITIVEHKQKSKRKQTPFWQRMYLDVILFAISLYLYYNFSGQLEQITARIQNGEALDPMIFLNSSLFIFSAGLLCLRLLPLITKLIYRIGKRFWKPAEYASFLQVIKTRRKQSFISVFLIMTLAMGILNAGIARTINKNAEDSLRYEVGADIVLQEKWKNNSYTLEDNPGRELEYYEPDESRFLELTERGAESVTKVYKETEVTASVNNIDLTNIELLGINTREFGKTAVMKTGILKEHFNSYLNLISQNTDALLLSTSFERNLGVKVGDKIKFKGENGKTCEGTVYGFVDAWPTFSSTIDVAGADGVVSTTDHYLIVAHFDLVQHDFGVLPYQIWIKVKEDTQFIYDFIEEQNLKLTAFSDSEKLLVDIRNDTIYQVTNGMLTINFIMTLLLCTVGFLIFWILSIRSRELMFGVYRAMGMSMKEFIRMLCNEHLFISFLSLACGAGIGVIASKLFVPLIEIAYRVTNQTLPIEILIGKSDVIRLAAVIVGMLVFCTIVLAVLISKIKIAQALKLGEE